MSFYSSSSCPLPWQAPHYDTELLESWFTGEAFELRSRSGYCRMSGVTDTEDVSYVTRSGRLNFIIIEE